MNIVTYPLNNVDYTAADAEIYNSTRTSGVYADAANLDISILGARSVVISPGMAWIKNDTFAGKAIAVKDDVELGFDAPDTTLNRIDRIVLGFSAIDNATTLYIKKGVAASTPTAPDVIQTTTLYELGLYDISIPAGLTALTTAEITDQRANDEVCGIMNDGVTRANGAITGVSINGTSVATSGVANIPAATTSDYGVVKLSSATSSTSTTLAATPSAVKSAYDLANTAKTNALTAQSTANAALPKSGGTMTGKLVAQNNTNYTTKQVRNIIAVAEGEDIPATGNGDVVVIYEA